MISELDEDENFKGQHLESKERFYEVTDVAQGFVSQSIKNIGLPRE